MGYYKKESTADAIPSGVLEVIEKRLELLTSYDSTTTEFKYDVLRGQTNRLVALILINVEPQKQKEQLTFLQDILGEIFKIHSLVFERESKQYQLQFVINDPTDIPNICERLKQGIARTLNALKLRASASAVSGRSRTRTASRTGFQEYNLIVNEIQKIK